jgi:hypothetical protein
MISKKAGFDAEGDDGNRTHATMSDLYPDVGRVILFVAFEEADSESEPNYQQIIFTPGTEAIFRLDCSRDECVGGGFDFAPIIDEMVKNKESRVHGELACAGTLGSGEHRCSLKAEYRIIVD